MLLSLEDDPDEYLDDIVFDLNEGKEDRSSKDSFVISHKTVVGTRHTNEDVSLKGSSQVFLNSFKKIIDRNQRVLCTVTCFTFYDCALNKDIIIILRQYVEHCVVAN